MRQVNVKRAVQTGILWGAWVVAAAAHADGQSIARRQQSVQPQPTSGEISVQLAANPQARQVIIRGYKVEFALTQVNQSPLITVTIHHITVSRNGQQVNEYGASVSSGRHPQFPTRHFFQVYVSEAN